MATAAAGKAALAAAGIIGAAAVVGPWLIGMRLESSFRDSVASLSAQSPYPITVSSYQRGLYAAEAETVIDIAVPPEPHSAAVGEASPDPEVLHLRLHHAISHGPRLDGLLRSARMVTTPVFDAEIAAALQPLFGALPLFTLITDVGYGGGASGSLRSPAIDTTRPGQGADAKPVHLQWSGVESTYALSGGHLRFHLDAPGLSLTGDDEASGSVGAIVAAADMSRIADSPIWIGTSTLSVDSIAFKAEAGGFSLNQLAIASDTAISNGLMNSGVRFSAATVALATQRLEQLRLNLAFDHLDTGAVTELSTALNRYQQMHGPDGAAANPAAMMAELKPALGRLAAGQPEVRVDELSFSGPEGAVKIDGALRYIGDANFDDFSPMTDLEGRAQLDAPLSYVNLMLGEKLRGDIATSAGVAPGDVPPEVIASSVQSTRNGLVAQGLLVVDGTRVSSKIDFKGGALSINGKALGVGAAPTAQSSEPMSP